MKNKELAVLILGTLLAVSLGLSYSYYKEYKKDRHDVEIILNEIDSTIYAIDFHIDTLDNFKSITTKYDSIKEKVYNKAFKRVIEGNKYNAIINCQELLLQKIANAEIECEVKENELMYYYMISSEKKRLSKSLHYLEQVQIKENIKLNNLIKERANKMLSGNF